MLVAHHCMYNKPIRYITFYMYMLLPYTVTCRWPKESNTIAGVDVGAPIPKSTSESTSPQSSEVGIRESRGVGSQTSSALVERMCH